MFRMMKVPQRHRIGRTRVRLAQMMTDLGYVTHPEDIHPQYGAWRTDSCLDVCRWEGKTTAPNGMTKLIQSWSTMTECVRRGIEITPDERQPSYVDVSAKERGR